jgi:hypothetical protein
LTEEVSLVTWSSRYPDTDLFIYYENGGVGDKSGGRWIAKQFRVYKIDVSGDLAFVTSMEPWMNWGKKNH